MDDQIIGSNEQLIQRIARKIQNAPTRLIPFHDYMQMCLYEPGLGYYMNGEMKIGKQGDFYTSSNIGSLMGEMLAAVMVRYWKSQPPSEAYLIAEWGGGNGRLADQILTELQNSFPDYYNKVQYQIVDTSSYHRRLQIEQLQRHEQRVSIWKPDQWEKEHIADYSIILSNELLDAFPVHRIKKTKHHLYEIMVGCEEDTGRFIEALQPISKDSELHTAIEADDLWGRLCEGQTAELCPGAGKWLASTACKLNKGLQLTIDYGDIAERLYTPDRMEGTLMCYYRHQAHSDPYRHIGEQDITAHVNFSACIREGTKSGMTEWSLVTQKQFLLDAGILDKLQNHQVTDPFHPIARRNRAIRQLLLGDGMAESFKVLTQKKGG